MMHWWITNQYRLRDEKSAIARLEDASSWLENVEWSLDDKLRLRTIFNIRLDTRTFYLQLTYHNTFPSSPPSVSPIKNIRVSGHQYGQGGDLCLQIRPDNWSPNYTGADMIRSAYELLVLELPSAGGIVVAAPSDHNVPDAIQLRGSVSRLYISADTQKILVSDAPDLAKVKFGFQGCCGNHVVAIIHELEKDNFLWNPPDVPFALTRESFLSDGILVRTSLPSESLFQISGEKELLSAIGIDEMVDDNSFSVLVVCKDGEVVLYRKLPSLATMIRYTTILQPKVANSRSGDEFSDLRSKRVGIVGLGSLGSKVAASLARTGVGEFILVDGDVLHAGNLERHDADWRDIALHKTDIVARRLGMLSPGIHCDSWRTAIGAQISPNEAGNVNAALDGCDLVVDATADTHVFNHLAGLVDTTNTTLVWGAVFAGGLGGEVARSRPQKDPSAFDIRNVINQVYSTTNEPAPLATKGTKYSGIKDDSHIVATDADVTAVASLVTAIVLDTLVEREPSRYDAHAFFVGNTRGWLFEGPFHVQPIIANAPVRKIAAQTMEEAIESEFVTELLQNKLHETKNNSKDN